MKNLRTGAGALAAGALLAGLASPAMAQPQFERLISFGDSYADSYINLLPLWMGLPGTYPSQGVAPETLAASYDFVPFPYWLKHQLGLADAQMTSYAIGGSTSQPTNAVGIPYSLPFQVETWGGRRFGEHDLVTLSIGGNDGLVASGTLPMYPGNPDGQAFGRAEAVALADRASGNIQATLETFAAAGARNIVLASFSDMTGIPATASAPHRESLSVYGENLFEGIQQKLRPLGQSGTRIFLVDVARVGEQVRDNLAGYGFGSYTYAGESERPSLFQPDNIHLSSHGFEVLARYMGNVVAAPYAHAVQPRVAQASARTFGGALLDRLDASRSFTSTSEGFTLYAIGAHRAGERDGGARRLGDDYRAGVGTLGGELRITPQLRAGLALGYTEVGSDLDGGDEVDDQAFQLAGYLSYYDGGWFGDALLGYGRHDLDLDRRGVLYPVSGSTDADTFGATLRGGYLFDLGGLRVGPLLGLRYSRTEVDGYRERGDALLAYRVDGQTLTSKTGEAGVQLRTPFHVAGRAMEGYLNLTWQHEFGDRNRTLTTTLEQAPLLPIRTSVDDFESRDHGVIGGGVSLALSDNLSVALSASTTFAGDDGHPYQVGTSLDYRF